MWNLLVSDARRALKNYLLWFGVLAIAAVGLIPLSWDLFHSGNYWISDPSIQGTALELRYVACIANGLQYLFPVLAMLPFGTAYCDDLATGYYKAIIYRINRNNYILARGISTILAGGLILLLGGLLFDTVLISVFPSYNPAVQTQFTSQLLYVPTVATISSPTVTGNLAPAALYNWVANNSFAGVKIALTNDLLWMVQGMGWASLGLVIAAIFPNRYITLAGPFIFGYIYNYALGLFHIHYITTQEFFLPEFISVFPPAVVFAIGLIPIIGFFALYYVLARRRFRNG